MLAQAANSVESPRPKMQISGQEEGHKAQISVRGFEWARGECDMRGRKGRQWKFHGFTPPSAPAAKIYIFGAKGEKEGGKERIFFVDLGSQRAKKKPAAAKDSALPYPHPASFNGRISFCLWAESRFCNVCMWLFGLGLCYISHFH